MALSSLVLLNLWKKKHTHTHLTIFFLSLFSVLFIECAFFFWRLQCWFWLLLSFLSFFLFVSPLSISLLSVLRAVRCVGDDGGHARLCATPPRRSGPERGSFLWSSFFFVVFCSIQTMRKLQVNSISSVFEQRVEVSYLNMDNNSTCIPWYVLDASFSSYAHVLWYLSS